MINIKKCLAAILISNFIILPSLTSFAAKKNSKANKSTQKQEETSSNSSSVIYVFPVETEKKPYKPVKRVITGIFTNKQQEKAEEEDKAKATEKEKVQAREIPPRTLNERTIAWITPMGIYYHDPNNNCLNSNERTWAEENKELVGLEPCPSCFKNQNKTPAFIKKQFGNLDVADSGHLLLNNEFISWAKERFPVKDISFISGTKILAYPTLDMTSKGMYQLAIELQGAYLRQTWRVAEVQVKSNPDVVEYVSSFSPNSELLGVVKNKEQADSKATSESTKAPRKPRLFP